MNIVYQAELKAEFPSEYSGKKLTIGLYDNDIWDEDDEEPQKVGQIEGVYYNLCGFGNIANMLMCVDDDSYEGSRILIPLTFEETIKKRIKFDSLHNFINIDRLYIFNKYKNKGYATKTLKDLKNALYELYYIEPMETVIGLFASPFKLKEENYDLNFSDDNMDVLREGEYKEKLINFYAGLGFRQTKFDSDVYYM